MVPAELGVLSRTGTSSGTAGPRTRSRTRTSERDRLTSTRPAQRRVPNSAATGVPVDLFPQAAGVSGECERGSRCLSRPGVTCAWRITSGLHCGHRSITSSAWARGVRQRGSPSGLSALGPPEARSTRCPRDAGFQATCGDHARPRACTGSRGRGRTPDLFHASMFRERPLVAAFLERSGSLSAARVQARWAVHDQSRVVCRPRTTDRARRTDAAPSPRSPGGYAAHASGSVPRFTIAGSGAPARGVAHGDLLRPSFHPEAIERPTPPERQRSRGSVCPGPDGERDVHGNPRGRCACGRVEPGPSKPCSRDPPRL